MSFLLRIFEAIFYSLNTRSGANNYYLIIELVAHYQDFENDLHSLGKAVKTFGTNALRFGKSLNTSASFLSSTHWLPFAGCHNNGSLVGYHSYGCG